MISRLVCIVSLLIGLASHAAYAYHDGLVVFVNGQRLTPQQIYEAEQAIGVRLRSGYYWYDQATGYWGLVNGPALGRVPPISAQGNTVTERFSGGGGASRNSTLGTGVITDGQGGAAITGW